MTTAAPSRLRRWVVWLYEGLLAALAFLTLWLLTQPEDEEWVRAGNLGIWVIFVADYVVRLARAPNRRVFVRQNLFELVAIMPLDFLRVARVARLFRLLRVAIVLWRVHRDVQAVLQTNGLGYILIFTAGLVVTGGIGISAVEPEIGTVFDGIWWSIVTATTVGYGDISPSTVPGRAIAALLMVVGIGTMGMTTASLTTYFLGHRKASNATIEHLRSRLEQWDELSSEERQELAIVLHALAAKPD